MRKPRPHETRVFCPMPRCTYKGGILAKCLFDRRQRPTCPHCGGFLRMGEQGYGELIVGMDVRRIRTEVRAEAARREQERVDEEIEGRGEDLHAGRGHQLPSP
jgi:hypothetical protein